MSESKYNPDVLSCLANLSNDEVFTPPNVVNSMLDMLPQELFESKATTFLDIGTKSGVFLREIAKRLIKGLESEIPDLQKRVDHILHKQLFGIATTELTSLVSRRTLYCSKYPNCRYSASKFDTVEGNIRFRAKKHDFVNGRCKWCGASVAQFDRDDGLESHAYEFIHTDKPEEIFNMKFDVIVGNPPYQMSFGLDGGNSSNAKSIYNLFIDKAMLLRPRYITMITPSRWMTKTAQGIPDSWVEKILQCNHFRELHDFEDVEDCFPGVSLTGGVSYFLIEMGYCGKCEYYFHQAQGRAVVKRVDFLDAKKTGVVIRNPQSYSIIEKIEKEDGNYYLEDTNFSTLVSPKHFFDDSALLTSNWRGYSDKMSEEYSVRYYLNLENGRTYRWIKDSQIPKHKETKLLHKVYIPAANGSMDQVLGRPFYGEPNSVCSQTYLVIGYDPERHNFSKEECLNIISYIKTRFFRYLVSIKKKTQNGPRGVYQFVPMQDFSKPWVDEELYKKYNLTADEIKFIESMIKPME